MVLTWTNSKTDCLISYDITVWDVQENAYVVVKRQKQHLFINLHERYVTRVVLPVKRKKCFVQQRSTSSIRNFNFGDY